MFYSHLGNNSFPTWEHFVPKVGIIEIKCSSFLFIHAFSAVLDYYAFVVFVYCLAGKIVTDVALGLV